MEVEKRNRYRARLRLAAWKQFISKTCQIQSLAKEEMNRQREEIGLSSSSGGENQLSILGQVTRELNEIEKETPNTLEQILMLRRNGVSDQEVDNELCSFYKAQV